MSWIKIDTDAATEDGPANSFVATALRRNANAYPTQLVRSVSHTYERWDSGAQTDGPQFVATHPEVYAGNWYAVDCGKNATRLDIRIRYATATTKETVRVRVRHPRSGSEVDEYIPPSTSVSVQDVQLNLREPLSGLQNVWVGFRSTIAEEPDTYPPSVLAASGSQVFGYQPVSPGTAWAGRMAKLLVMPNIGDTSTNVSALPALFFVGYAAPATQFDAGADVGLRMDVWPDVETQPAALPYLADTTKSAFASTYDLGVCYLYGVAFGVAYAANDSFTPAYAHDGMSAAGIMSYQTSQRAAANTFAHTLAIAPSPAGDWHGRLLSSGDTESRVFVSRYKYSRVRMALCLIATDVGDALPAIRLRILDAGGTTLAEESTTVQQSTSAWLAPRRTLVPVPNTSLALANMSHTPGDWGMGSLSSDSDALSTVALTVDVQADVGDPLVAEVTYDAVAGKGLMYVFGLTETELVEEDV